MATLHFSNGGYGLNSPMKNFRFLSFLGKLSRTRTGTSHFILRLCLRRPYCGFTPDDIELMTQKEVLDFKLAPRLEQIGYRCRKQMDDRKHRFG